MTQKSLNAILYFCQITVIFAASTILLSACGNGTVDSLKAFLDTDKKYIKEFAGATTLKRNAAGSYTLYWDHPTKLSDINKVSYSIYLSKWTLMPTDVGRDVPMDSTEGEGIQLKSKYLELNDDESPLGSGSLLATVSGARSYKLDVSLQDDVIYAFQVVASMSDGTRDINKRVLVYNPGTTRLDFDGISGLKLQDDGSIELEWQAPKGNRFELENIRYSIYFLTSGQSVKALVASGTVVDNANTSLGQILDVPKALLPSNSQAALAVQTGAKTYKMTEILPKGATYIFEVHAMGPSGELDNNRRIAVYRGTNSEDVTRAEYPECKTAGEIGCITTQTFWETITQNLANKVISGQTIMGISGNVTLPAAGNVRTSNGTYGVGGTSITPSLADCGTDGATSCVAIAAYTAAATSGLANKVVSGQTVAGIAGNVTLPTAANVRASNGTYGVGGTATTPTLADCGTDGATSCVAIAAYTAAATSGLANKVVSGQTVAGIAGNVTLPTAANVRASNGTYGVGGTATTPTLADCGTDGSIGCVAVGPSFAAAATSGLANKVVSGQTVAGIAGNVTLPTASNVWISNGTYGVGGTTTTPSLDDCRFDGATSCVAVAAYTAAATSGLANKVLSGQTVAGIAGNVTQAPAGKVLTGTSYGVNGTALSGTLTLPSAANVLSGSGTYGEQASLQTPSYTPPIYARPTSPTVTSTAFNLSPDRISLSWTAVSSAAGYIVIMNNGSAVTWTPTDGTTYTTGTQGSDTIIYVGSGTSVTYNTPITSGTNYYFAIYSYQANHIYTDTPSTKTLVNCTGLAGGTWIPVPGDSVYGTNAFCVMKYLASNVNSVATSQAGTSPWTTLSQTAAQNACSSLGSNYHLLTNPEWMTITANAAGTANNWSTGIVGSGYLPRGHSDNNPGSVCAANSNDANAYVETNCTGSNTGGFDQRRTQILSNSEIIWDIAGNTWNWVDYLNSSDKPTPAQNAWYEFTAITPSTTTPLAHMIPQNSNHSWWVDSWTSTQNIGKMAPGANNSGGAMLRGGAYNRTTIAGMFAILLNTSSGSAPSDTSFRCAWQP